MSIKHKLIVVSILILIVFSAVSPAYAGKNPPHRRSVKLITLSTSGLASPGLTTTDFESSDGFSPGACDGQNGWVYFHSTTAGQISTAHPNSGSQHLRIAYDSSIGAAELTGCVRTATQLGDYAKVNISISATGGADYNLSVQNCSGGTCIPQGQITLDYNGDVWVFNGTSIIDTGLNWTTGSYHTVKIEHNGGNVAYYYDGSSAGTYAQWSGSGFDAVMLVSNNYQITETGDFDGVELRTGGTTATTTTSFGADSVSWALPAVIGTLATAGAITLRKRL